MARILIVGINYAPENIGTGKYTGEMATWLALNGHAVRVVTAPPYYPDWRVSSGYRSWWWSRDEIQGVDVIRCPIWVPSKPRGVTRIVHLFSFGFTSLPPLIGSMLFRPDLVVNIAPTLASAPGALLVARLSGSKSWLHIQDFELDAALEMGIVSAGRMRALATAIESRVLRAFNRVSTISEKMLERVRAKGVKSSACISFPNWADIAGIRPLETVSSYRSELGIPVDGIVALYSGNMGLKQGLEVLGDVADAMKDLPSLYFVFGGQGPARDLLEEKCKGLSNVHFLDLQPTERLNDWLGLADIHLLPQRADVADLVMPSKLTGMLASGRPILATALPNTGLANALKSSGITVPPGDKEAIAQALRELVSSPAARVRLGLAAREQAEATLASDWILDRFNTSILSLLASDASNEHLTNTDSE